MCVLCVRVRLEKRRERRQSKKINKVDTASSKFDNNDGAINHRLCLALHRYLRFRL